MTWRLKIARSAERNLRRVPDRDRRRIVAALAELAQDPYAAHGVVKLTNYPAGFRLRVGAYRVLYDIVLEERCIEVLDILRRSSTTYRR